MRITLASRAVAAAAAGLALGDCVLLAGGVLLWTAHLHGSLDADSGADRTHTWLRCVGQGLALIALGLLLAANTLGVVLGVRGEFNGYPWLAAALLLLFTFAGGVPTVRPTALRSALLLLALVALFAPSLVGIGWAPCAFAAITALLALGHGGYRLGPLARRLAAPGRLR